MPSVKPRGRHKEQMKERENKLIYAMHVRFLHASTDKSKN